MDAFQCFVLLFLFVFKTVDDVVGDCTLSLKKDFGSPAPVFIRDKAYLAPDDTGAISFKRSETVTVACPGPNKLVVLGNRTSSYNIREAHCIINSTFRVDQWIGEFKDIRCNGNPIFSTQQYVGCFNGGTLYGVGYKIKNWFFQLYEACFNRDLLTTYYVKHKISPYSVFMQSGSKRPKFTEGDLFGKVRMSKVYKVANQNDRLNAELGPNASGNYVTKKQYLTRGHLAARADYIMRAETRATFHYINSAPQWQRGNAGDWAALEDALRRRIQTLGRPVMVMTGTHLTMTLPDAKGKRHSIYLYADENNNLQVPVPLYFYKLVYDPIDRTATAFVLINSSFYNSTLLDKLTFCDDVCGDSSQLFSWLKWRAGDGTHSFCCSYEDFINEVDYLDELYVTGLFY